MSSWIAERQHVTGGGQGLWEGGRLQNLSWEGGVSESPMGQSRAVECWIEGREEMLAFFSQVTVTF